MKEMNKLKDCNGERAHRLLQSLPEVWQALLSADNVRELAQRSCYAIGGGIGAQYVFALWYSDSERAFVGLPSGYGIEDAQLINVHIPAGMCAASDHAFVHGEPYISQFTDEEELLTHTLRRYLQLTRLLTLPIRDDQQIRGVLHVAGRGGRGFDKTDISYAFSIAQACGAAIGLLHYRHYSERVAITDGLTGLFNRYRMEELVEQQTRAAAANGTPLSVAVVYLDHLKHINDTYGYRIGDAALLAVTRALQQCVVPRALVGRYAGDEFVVLMPNIGLQEAQRQMQAVRDMIARGTHEPVGNLSVSIGVACYPESAIRAEQLFSFAEDAAIAAKRHGRNQVVMVAPRNAA